MKDEKGFTLLEMLLCLGIFSLLLTAVMGAFLRGFSYQKRIIELQAVQREGSYLVETLSREIRMATDINNATERGNADSNLTFTNHDGSIITYCRSDASGACTSEASPGEYFSIGGKVVSSSDIKVTNLKFYVSNQQFWSASQPLVTIVMELQSRKDPQAKILLQSSVATRLYTKS